VPSGAISVVVPPERRGAELLPVGVTDSKRNGDNADISMKKKKI